MTQVGDELVFDLRLNLEGFIAGIDQDVILDTNDAPQAAAYDALRALEPDALATAFEAHWPTFAANTDIIVDGQRATLVLREVSPGAVGDVEQPRSSQVQFAAALPADATAVTVGWDRTHGTLVIRQMGVDAPYDGYLQKGETSVAIALAGGGQAGGFATFINYIPVGFDHIVPLGLDHILFVLGLFFLSTRMRPLLMQVTAFTLAHTITLALAATGYVTVPASIVEPLIAASIVYVAIENLFTDGLSPWRPFVVFGLGLLHGLGFASVLAEFGLPAGSFLPALIGFNVGVEIGQLAVIAVAFVIVLKAVQIAASERPNRLVAAVYLLASIASIAAMVYLIGQGGDIYADVAPLFAAVALLLGFSAAASVVGRAGSYREIVAMPGSIIIAIIAAYWTFERVFL